MRADSCGILVVLMALGASVAACGESDGAKGGSGGGGAGNAGGQGSGVGGFAGTSQVSGSSGSGGGSQAGSGAGGAPQEGCKILGEGETGAHGLKLVYASEEFGAFYGALGIDGGNVYFTADGQVMSYPVAGGTAAVVGDYVGSRQVVRGGTIYGFKPGADGALGSMVSAPLTDTSMTTTLAESIAEPQLFVADDTALYFDRRDPSSIFKLPLAGGTAEEIVPEGSPLGMISHMGHLYWLDFSTNYLERVPVAGGPRERLAEVFFGGPMAAEGDSVFWADTSLGTVESWQEGATTTKKLSEGADFFDSPEYVAVAGDTVYWILGFNCGVVQQVKKDGSGASLYTQGTSGADWVGVADGALFVLGRGGLYRADR